MITFNPINHLVLLLVLCFTKAFCFCPEYESIKPCVCEDNTIYCEGTQDMNLVNIFATLEKSLNKKEKHFNGFHLNNTAITELKDYTFKDITFNEIAIENCYNLTTIDNFAFGANFLFTRKVTFSNNSLLSRNVNSIFNILSRFYNVEEITLLDNNLVEIPSNAFKPLIGYQDYLKTLKIGGTSISKIGDSAFFSLRNVKNITIHDTSIAEIHEYAFKFNMWSNMVLNNYLTLQLLNNINLSSSSFHENSLVNIGRPTILQILGKGLFKTFYYNTFWKFLKSDPNNKIIMDNHVVDCQNCQNVWLKENPDQTNRIQKLNCQDGIQIYDQENFANCRLVDLLKPCRFIEIDFLLCENQIDLNLKAYFTNVSKWLEQLNSPKHFLIFALRNSTLDELEGNTFNDITFDRINIENCSNLKTIDQYAFSGTEKALELKDNPMLKFNEGELSKLLNQFNNLEFIYLETNSFTDFPFNVLPKTLEKIMIVEPVTRLKSRSIYDLPNLNYIYLNARSLEIIEDYAFERNISQNDNHVKFDISFEDVNSTSIFSDKSLLKMNRQATIHFEWDATYFIVLDEKSFLPFILDHGQNHIFCNCKLDCQDCNNYWIKQIMNERPTEDLFTAAGCSNSTEFIWESVLHDDNFKSCNKIHE